MYSQYMYYWDGYLVASCLNIKLSRVEKPQGYSAGRVEEILQPYEKSKDHEKIGDDLIEDFNDSDRMYDEELPHVILIMNESFADMQVLGDLQMNQDNIPFFRSLQDNTIKGYLYSSIMGGGTANSEFEVLTGCSCAFLPASYYPYQQCLASREVPSMVSMMKKQGYTTYAMHPATEKNWERGSTYKRLGFDHTYWEQDFDGGERIHFGTSDAETYRKVIELYEKRQRNEKMFLFDVTIQNHGAYYESDVEQIIQATNVDSVELNNYLSLVYQSDLALQELISYFEQQDEKVVVCMFGDHQPAFANEDFYREIRGDAMTDEEQIWNKYKVPFVIWANYELEESQGHEMSMNFFGEFLMHALGFETSPFFDYLKDLRKGSPVLTSNGYLGEDGQVKEWSENNTEFLDYRILQYYYLFSTSKAFKGFE